jgi:tRNA modification GTPase
MSNTIFALASAHGRAGVAVIRVSGGRSWDSLKALCPAGAFTSRLSSLRKLIHPETSEILDEALILPFKGPNSYTGEDTVEYHLHGGRAVIDSVLDFLGSQDGHRMAEPGEFTRRAFENGRMDLTEAEAVADLIDAETQVQKMQALSQMGGALSGLYEGWSERLKKLLAHMEADIEFPDEDLPDGIAPEITDAVAALSDDIAEHLNDNRQGERLRDGIQVAIVGAPNAGKSSLVNALVQRDVAIISDMAGTTRDVIEAHLDIGGYPVILADTAGLRPDQIGSEGHDALESEGIKRAMKRAQDADIVILLFDGAQDMPDPHTLNLIDERSILVCNKVDVMAGDVLVAGALPLSVRRGHGIDALLVALLDKLKTLIISREAPSLTRKRHRQNLDEALESLKRSQNADLPELMAEDLRLSIRSLGKITGRVDVEDLLDVIFKDFCIGK